MKNLKMSTSEKIVWTLTVLLIVSFTVLETYSWGRYLFLGIVGAIYLFFIGSNKKLQFPLAPFQKYALIFDGYIFLSAFWAWNKNATIVKGLSVFQIIVLLSIVYIYYSQNNNPKMIIYAVKWAGIIVALYTINYFGIDGIISASTSSYRIGNVFSNSNNIGLICAVSIFIAVYTIIYEKFDLESFFIIPCLLALTATQSRKALIFVVVGIICLILLKSKEENNLGKSIFVLFVLVIIILLGAKVISTMDIFSGINERMSGLFGLIDKSDVVDHSTKLRNDMSSLGISWWLKYPLTGIGVGNPYLLNVKYLGENAYLHNNYVELLCGGGIIGTILYYCAYIYILYELIKYRKEDFQIFVISFIWVLLTLILDYGMVTYYEKSQWFYIMIHFLNIRYLKRRSINEQ